MVNSSTRHAPRMVVWIVVMALLVAGAMYLRRSDAGTLETALVRTDLHVRGAPELEPVPLEPVPPEIVPPEIVPPEIVPPETVPLEPVPLEDLPPKDVTYLLDRADPGDDKAELSDEFSDPAGSESSTSRLTPSANREPYTWHDGNQVRQVWLDASLVVVPDGDGLTRDDIRVGDTTRGGASADSSRHDGEPVFWSDSGELMALPGGVVVVLDAGWDSVSVNAFFEQNSISMAQVSELGFVTNGFYIETEPGFPSLELANNLATHPGVELSSPDWWIERTLK